MNIKITHSWLLEYVDTDATPQEIQTYLSLCGPSIERIDKVGDEIVYDIEITSNRIDSASVFGIALEAAAILPMFGKKAILKKNPIGEETFSSLKTLSKEKLTVTIDDPTLCPRFTAIVLDNVTATPSPDVIQKRLRAVGVKVINSVIDISNYLMIELGQPSHVFNYDAIGKHTMKMRESKKGERLITLDEREIILPGGDIVIEDGDGKLIDLCGIMGGYSSRFIETAKRIVFFVQNYDKVHVRRTMMKTGQRTLAGTYFEKGLDNERVESTLVRGAHLLSQFAGAQVVSPIQDIYPSPYNPKSLSFAVEDITKKIGVEIDKQKIINILSSLQFAPKEKNNTITVTIPSFRQYDISILEDIVEEVARVYGYFAIPSTLQEMRYIEQPKDTESLFTYQEIIKSYLKHIGLHEVMNYSACSLDLLKAFDLNEKDHIYITNSISQDIKYLRTSLIPSLVQNSKQNEGFSDELWLFEIAKTYLPNGDKLPTERFKIGIAVNTSFSDLKGIIDGLVRELHIPSIAYKQGDHMFYSPRAQGTLRISNGENIGTYGLVKTQFVQAVGAKKAVYTAEFDFDMLVHEAKRMPMYKPFSQFATITLDLTMSHKKSFAEIKRHAYDVCPHLVSILVKDTYKDTITLRLSFTDSNKNLTEKEALLELEKIKSFS